MHCEFPACAVVCPVEAITKYEEGPVVINQEVCIGCEYCIYACPWGALSEKDIRSVVTKDSISGKAAKCTMCSDRVREAKKPFCVDACPVEALDFGLKEEISEKASKRAAEVGGSVYGQTEAGGTQVICVLERDEGRYGFRTVGREKIPRHRIPLSLMLRDLFTLRCGVKGKLRALRLAFARPRRLLYRYWPWYRPAA
jgi:formate dehydrogenase iron-sulfur subunit